MPSDTAPTPDKFILATLRDPVLRLRHTIWVDLIHDAAGFHAVPRGIPLEGVGPTPEDALDRLRETLRTSFKELRSHRNDLQADEKILYYLLHAIITSSADEDSTEICGEVPVPADVANRYGIRPGITLFLTSCRGFFQATFGKTYLSAIGTSQLDAIQNFCALVQSLHQELSQPEKCEKNQAVFSILQDLRA
ncbi:MAG: hypothetical protein AAB215_07645 [Planctomycetota bacterium]